MEVIFDRDRVRSPVSTKSMIMLFTLIQTLFRKNDGHHRKIHVRKYLPWISCSFLLFDAESHPLTSPGIKIIPHNLSWITLDVEKKPSPPFSHRNRRLAPPCWILAICRCVVHFSMNVPMCYLLTATRRSTAFICSFRASLALTQNL